jgi:hypothetical protein
MTAAPANEISNNENNACIELALIIKARLSSILEIENEEK